MSLPVAGAVLAVALWVVSATTALRLGRAAIARMPFDWRSHPEFREQNEAVLSARLADSFRGWGRTEWMWAAALLAASFAFAAMDFTLAFTVLYAAVLSAYFEGVQAHLRWLQRLEDVELLGPPTFGSKAWHAAFTVVSFLATFAYFAFFACAGYAVAEALTG